MSGCPERSSLQVTCRPIGRVAHVGMDVAGLNLLQIVADSAVVGSVTIRQSASGHVDIHDSVAYFGSFGFFAFSSALSGVTTGGNPFIFRQISYHSGTCSSSTQAWVLTPCRR